MTKFKSTFLFLTLFAVSTVTTSKIGNITNSTDSSKIYCVDSLYDLETSLKSDPKNIENIDDGFLPLNGGLSLWVKVNIYYNLSTTSRNAATTHPNPSIMAPDFIFQWVSSSLFLYFGPEEIQLLSGASIGHKSREINIVVNPICNLNLLVHVILLDKLVVKLPKFSTEPENQLRGFSAFFLKGKQRTVVERYENKTINAETTIFSAILFLNYCLSIGLMLLTPLMLLKLHILPIPQKILNESGQLRISLFVGFVVASLFFFVLVIHHDADLVHKFSNDVVLPGQWPVSMWKLMIPVPIPLIVFAILNCFTTIHTINIRGFPIIYIHTLCQRCCVYICVLFQIIAIVLITLFLQALSFHLGWFVLMLIAFPLQTGALFLNFVAMYFALGLFISGLVQGLITCKATGRAYAQEMIGGSFLLVSIFFLTVAYYGTITYAGFHYRDGISAMMPSLAPLLLVGSCTWIVSKTSGKLLGYDINQNIFQVNIQQKLSGIGDYYKNNLKDLPV